MSFHYLAENGSHVRSQDDRLRRERSKISLNKPENYKSNNRPQVISYPQSKDIQVVNPKHSHVHRAQKPLPPQRVCPCQKR